MELALNLNLYKDTGASNENSSLEDNPFKDFEREITSIETILVQSLKEHQMNAPANFDYTKISVANIPSGTSQETLTGLFNPFGLIASIELNKHHAVIEYEETTDCWHALQNMNGFAVGDEFLVVELVK
ncbi:hypothetical protein QCA50_013908 [Cerrena zonata]|uniref:RRM domain-containing protein n=1 Tax=Cerrena zonata TaxID=2478898 RepID=A0AAW0FZ04_9APHY